MRHPASALLLAATLTASACAPGVEPPRQPVPTSGLAAVIDSVLSTPPLHRTHWGVHVTDMEGRVVVSRNAERLFSTASNAKVPTMAAALALLGPDFRWSTAVEVRGLVDGVAGAVVVHGSGDPTLSAHFHADPLAPLDSLADSLALAGIRRIEGPLIVDASRFDSILTHPAWERFDLDWYYAAPVAPFAVMEGAYPVVMTPRAPGTPAAVHLPDTRGLVGADAQVGTVAGSRGWNDDLRRVAGTDSVVLRGEMGAEAGADTSWIAQDDPGRLAGRALVLALASRGIQVTGPVIVTRDVASLALSAGIGPVFTWRSPPLASVVPLSLEQSNNWVTEQVLKTLGAERGEGGSWSAGTAVVEQYLVEVVGIDAGAMYLRGGSGLTFQTLLTPAALTALLRHVADQPWGTLYRSAMPGPGEAESTLERRLLEHEGRLEAKTGTIRHTNALSGYARTADGRTLVFSILTNTSGRPASEVRAAMDRIVEAIIEQGS